MFIKAKDAECGSSMAIIEKCFMLLAHQDCAAARVLSTPAATGRWQPQQSMGIVESSASRSSSQMEDAVFAQSASQ